jgi:lipid A 3-O-deacylase
MMNDKNTLPRMVVVCVLATLVAASHAVHADEVGVLAGGHDGYHNLALSYQTAPLWQGEFAAHPLDASLEYSLGMVRAPSGQPDRDLLHVGVTPFARWWFASNTGAELGVGANVFSGTHLGDKDISTAFQFGSSVGLFHQLQGTPWLLGLRLTHYSNAGIERPNPGQNYVQLRASYIFP